MSSDTCRTSPVALRLARVSLAVAWLFVMAAAASADTIGLHRGISMTRVLDWAQIKPGTTREFAFPPFPERSSTLTLDTLPALRRTGFDFVRLPVDPGPFLQLQGPHRDDLDRTLIDRVNLILSAGFSVIIDFHPSGANPDYTARALTIGADTPIFQAYLRLLGRTAGLLDTLHSRKVSLELMNEPPVRAQTWQPMLEAAYAAARRRSTGLMLILDGADEASAEAMMAVDPRAFAKDPAAVFTFHYYAPYQFTHQGAPWNAARYLTDVPYPARARPLTESLKSTAAAIARTALSQSEKSLAYDDAQQRLTSYWRSEFDRNAIARTFDQVAAWARRNELPPDRVLLGEFGARRADQPADNDRVAERARWFRDVREEAEARDFPWAAWTYRDSGGFGLVDNETSNEIDREIAAALGLSPGSHAERSPGDQPATGRAKP